MRMYIDGEWRDSGNGATLEKFSPVTGGAMEEFPAGTRDDVDEAVEAAERSWPAWNDMGSVARSRIIYRARELIEKNRGELESILLKENGKVKKEAEGEVDGVIDQIQYYAEFARKITGSVVESGVSDRTLMQYKVPYGVVVALTPWNFPAGMVARKLAPAMMTGNSVVLKPSSDTPLAAEWIVRKFAEAGVPQGVVNLVTGRGSEIGDYIVSHRKVSLITMTGSTEVGQRIMEKAAGNMAKLILELGGKAPFMVWRDAEVRNALKALLWAKFWNTGQSCIAAERLYVHEDIYESFMKRFVEAAGRMKVGDPESADMGPLINTAALEGTEKFVQEASDSGMDIMLGGKRPDLKGSFRNGYFYEPTIIGNATQDSPLFQEEVFGPVIGSARVSDEDEMLALANDSKYGLSSYLFTQDPGLMFRAAGRVRFGELYINTPGPEESQGYHTGFRMTGQAGEGSKYGIGEYLKLKNVYIGYSKGELHIDTVRDDLL